MKPRFISLRQDGLGSRLIPLMNAVAMAKLTGGSFEFAWPDHDRAGPEGEMVSAQELFSERFLEEHYRPGWLTIFDMRQKAGDKRERYDAHLVTKAIVPDLISSTCDPMVCRIAEWADLRSDSGNPNIYQEAFAEISFSSPVQEAIQAAKEVPLPDGTTAIHLRGGDVIYDQFRFSGFHAPSWALPFPLARQLAERMGPVLAFGQDREVIAHVCGASNATSVLSLSQHRGMNPLEAWFFEACLMARCKTIVAAPRSAFSGFASLISGIEKTNGYRLVSDEELLALVRNHAPDGPVSNLQKAHAFWAVFFLNPGLAPEERLQCLVRARQFDPQNGLYGLALASELVATSRSEEARSVLSELVALDVADRKPRHGSLRHVLRLLRRPESEALRNRILPRLEKLMAVGNSEAALCLALTAQSPEDIETARRVLSNWGYFPVFRKAISRWLESLQTHTKPAKV